jgi:hypothetical protein
MPESAEAPMNPTAHIPPPRRLGFTITSAAVLFGVLRVGEWTPPLPVSVASEQVNVAVAALGRVAPGTQIADAPPPGWTHLILKSQPRVADEHRRAISETVVHMTEMLFTVMLARVDRGADGSGLGPYRLADVATGVGMTVGGRPTVVSSETQERLGCNLSFLDRRVLAGGEEELDQMHCVARSARMMVIDAPSYMLDEGGHRMVVVRYAVLVDGVTGRLTALVWALDPARPAAAALLRPVELLAPGAVQDCALSVKTAEFIAGIPVSKKSFAIRGLPRGARTVETSGETGRLLATKAPLSPETARRIESLLKEQGSEKNEHASARSNP